MRDAPQQQGLTLVDAHVHLYDCFDLATLLDSAYEHFSRQATRYGKPDRFTGVLMLAETGEQDRFAELHAGADHGSEWTLTRTDEDCSLLARTPDGRELALLAGRQIISREKLEVLALATRARFPDGTPTEDLLVQIQQRNAIAVLPWGVGKWFGNRGTIVRSLLSSTERPKFFLGDNGGRPLFWPRPGLMRLAERAGIGVLPGTDPLPLASQELRCGSFGFAIKGLPSVRRPGADVTNMIDDSTSEMTPYGKLETPLRFVRNQLRLRLDRG
jgi:hypothetical protein